MQYVTELITSITAIVAIVIAIKESRRNNKVILKIIECSACGHGTRHRNGVRSYHELRILLRNCGIALHDVQANISFHPPDDYGIWTMPLKRGGDQGDRAEFGKGMIGQFGFKSCELSKDEVEFLKVLRDPRKQDAYLSVFSQGYLARSFRIGGPWDRLKFTWNRWACRVNELFEHRIGKNKEGGDVVSAPHLMPEFTTLWDKFMVFRQWIEEEHPGKKGDENPDQPAV